ncbi:MAG: hypothetical protein ABI923_13665 [bacterium]
MSELLINLRAQWFLPLGGKQPDFFRKLHNPFTYGPAQARQGLVGNN